MRRSGSRRLAMLLVGSVASLTLGGFTPSLALSADARRALSLINGSRARAGLPPLASDGALNSIAQSHAERMAAQGRVYHNASYPGAAGAFEAWAENVGSSGNVDSAHRAFMASSGHRANILSPRLTRIGIGTARWSGGVMVVHDFIRRPGDQPARAPGPATVRPRQPAPPRAEPPPPPPEPDEPLGCHWTFEEGSAVVLPISPLLIE